MAQEKPTSIRVLQSNKKKPKSPILYIVIGVIAGVFVSISLFLFLSQPYSSESAAIESKSTEEQILNQETAHSSDEQNQVAVSQDNETDSMSRDGFEQPKDNELSNIFKPAQHKPATTNEQRVSPFDEQLTGEKKVQVVPQLQTGVAKTAQPKVQLAQQKPVSKPQQQQAAQAKPVVENKAPAEPEVEVEPPKASVDIKITRSPFAVN
ncbi:hypothetical protein [Acinetobacter calcoaceticus]|uniref:Uncharacterized protein (DUF4415 family) n=1 Tax=Acinetobacter calcoaceticus TaxID=471 RepID=A0ABD5AKE0_ACICA|nr:hypothetical protein [Acinetobacter calcoaceticus]MDP9802821.1 uncharacterized protein (DUF4415 family) [Acinetobacter calcoaceticus]